MPAEPTDTEPREDQRGEGFPQILHDRSRTAGEELHKLLLSLSTGALGIYFIAMTTATEPPLTRTQIPVVLTGLACMGVALGAGIVGWLADCRRNYFWASALQQERRADRTPRFKKRDRWLAVERVSTSILGIGFCCGILASIAYVVLRVLHV